MAVEISPIFFWWALKTSEVSEVLSSNNDLLELDTEAQVFMCLAFYQWANTIPSFKREYQIETVKDFDLRNYGKKFSYNPLFEGKFTALKSCECLLVEEKEEKAKKPSKALTFKKLLKLKKLEAERPWSEEDKGLIPSFDGSDDFIITDTFTSILKKVVVRWNAIKERMDGKKSVSQLVGNTQTNFLLFGTPGTGKTSLTQRLGQVLGLPVSVVSLFADSDSSDLQEKIVVGEEGKLQQIPSEFFDRASKPGIIVLEDYNIAPPEVVNGLLSFLEAPYVFSNGHEKFERHPLCFVFMTMNPDAQGTNLQNQALLSRLDKYEMNMPKDSDFIRILSSHTEKPVAKAVYNAFKSIYKTVLQSDPDIAQNLTMRSCLQMIANLNEGATFKDALKAITNCVNVVDAEGGHLIEEGILSDNSLITPFKWEDTIVDDSDVLVFEGEDKEAEKSEEDAPKKASATPKKSSKGKKIPKEIKI